MNENTFNTNDFTVCELDKDENIIVITDKFGYIKQISVDEFNGMLGMLFQANEIDFEEECEN
jgi:hypothetical protein